MHPDTCARQKQRELMDKYADTFKDKNPVVDLVPKYMRLTNTAIRPTKSHENDFAWDFYANESYFIEPGETVSIKTGIAMRMPDGWGANFWPRSGLSSKHSIDVLAGVIDAGYVGELKVCLHNHFRPTLFQNIWSYLRNDWPEGTILISKGDRVAQLQFHRVPKVKWVEVSSLEDTVRGNKGFGSTGK